MITRHAVPGSTPMKGKTCVVTGANSGIGKVTARELARLGARTILVCRREAEGRAAVDEIRRETQSDAVELMRADLAALSQVRELAARLGREQDRIDVLVNNAGLMLNVRCETEDGHEHVFAVNHLAPFLLTRLLQAQLVASAPARVVNVASEIHRIARLDLDDAEQLRATCGAYRGMAVYARSKLANILFTHELARRLAGRGVTANALHPGVIGSGFGRETVGLFNVAMKIARPFMSGPERGAQTSIFLASSPQVHGASGGYYVRKRRARPSAAARDGRAARRLWDLSRELVGG